MTDEDKTLDATFAQMCVDDVMPSEALIDRIMVDADRVLAAAIVAPVRPKQGLGAMLLDAIGGWPSLSGLAAATVAGVWIGVAPPDALSDLSAGYLGTTVEVSPLGDDIFSGLDG